MGWVGLIGRSDCSVRVCTSELCQPEQSRSSLKVEPRFKVFNLFWRFCLFCFCGCSWSTLLTVEAVCPERVFLAGIAFFSRLSIVPYGWSSYVQSVSSRGSLAIMALARWHFQSPRGSCPSIGGAGLDGGLQGNQVNRVMAPSSPGRTSS